MILDGVALQPDFIDCLSLPASGQDRGFWDQTKIFCFDSQGPRYWTENQEKS